MVKLVLYIIDTYAWVEYFIGSQKGKKVREIVHSEENRVITLECCLAEFKGWCLREGKNFDEAHVILKANSEIEAISLEDWLDAAEIRHNVRKKIHDFGMIDSLILVEQEKNKCRVLTGDPHFKGIANAEFL